MKLKFYKILSYLLFAIVYFHVNDGIAQNEKIEVSAEGDQLSISNYPPFGLTALDNNPWIVQDPATFLNTNAASYLELKINPDVVYNTAYTSTLTFTVYRSISESTSNQGGAPFPGVYDNDNTEEVTLEVSYNPNASSGNKKNIDLKIFNDWHGSRAVLNSIAVVDDSTGGTISIIPENLKFTLGFKSEFYDQLDEEAIPVFEPNLPGEKELVLEWSNVRGIKYYELEWTWVDSYDKANDGSDIDFTIRDFELNNTRIQTDKNTYEIPLVYDKGFIIYRVRGVGVFLDNPSINKYTQWSTGNPSDSYAKVSNWPNKVAISEEHDNKNWQFQASYAEEGKKKEVVSYFDGTLRNRQTVTKINTDNSAIVGEVIYDNQGRPAIEVLPVPTNASGLHVENATHPNSLQHYIDFNLNEAGTVYNHEDFDWNTIDDPSCNMATPGMSNTTGASGYYGEVLPIDPEKPYQNLVPNANKFPFSQIQYTSDNTGRIKAKGGVGEKHQIHYESDDPNERDHEMQYFYTTPEPEELTRLFGQNVGNALHYKKNIVIDPNGQASISYIDPQGRTIATALQGDAPPNLQALDALGGFEDDTADLLQKNATATNGEKNIRTSTSIYPGLNDSWSFVKPIISTKENTILSFDYGLDLASGETAFTPENCNKKYPYTFNLSINLINECGDEALLPHDNVGSTVNNVTYNENGNYGISLVQASTDGAAFNHSKTLTTNPLNIGSYQLSKTLTVLGAEEAADQYIEDISTEGNDCYIAPITIAADVSGCFSSCEECINGLGLASKQDYVLNELEDLYPGTQFNAGFDSGNNHAIGVFEESKLTVNWSGTPTNIAQVRLDVISKLAEYKTLLEGCDEFCNDIHAITGGALNLASCAVYESNLRADITPGGQYGAIDAAENNYNVSVYNDSEGGNGLVGWFETGLITTQNTNWRTPLTAGGYRDASNNPSYVKVIITEDNTGNIIYSPAIIQNNPNDRVYNELGGEIDLGDVQGDVLWVKPEHLANVEDFIDLLGANETWLDALLPYHPEYQYSEFSKIVCQTPERDVWNYTYENDPSVMLPVGVDGYAAYVQSIKTFDEAYNGNGAGFNLFGSIDALYTNDPYFQGEPVSLPSNMIAVYDYRKSIMEYALNTEYDNNEKDFNMLQAAVAGVTCEGLSPNACNVNSTITPTSINNDNNLPESHKNRIWEAYKGYYLGLRARIRTTFLNAYGKHKGVFNVCIGEDSYSTDTVTGEVAEYNNFATNIDTWIFSGSAIQYICNDDNAPLFANDYIEKRFKSANGDLYDDKKNAEENPGTDYEMYLQTGKCPLLFDLEYFLNGLLQESSSTGSPFDFSNSSFPYTGGYITKDLANNITQGEYPSGFPIDYTRFIGTANSGVMEVTVVADWNPIGDYYPIRLNIPQDISNLAMDWGNYNNADNSDAQNQWRINRVYNMYYDAAASNPSERDFKFKANVSLSITKSGNTEIVDTVISGSTPIAVGECTIGGEVYTPGGDLGETTNGILDVSDEIGGPGEFGDLFGGEKCLDITNSENLQDDDHIVFIIDQSSSISPSEKEQIRLGLESFLSDVMDSNINIYVSFFGMEDNADTFPSKNIKLHTSNSNTLTHFNDYFENMYKNEDFHHSWVSVLNIVNGFTGDNLPKIVITLVDGNLRHENHNLEKSLYNDLAQFSKMYVFGISEENNSHYWPNTNTITYELEGLMNSIYSPDIPQPSQNSLDFYETDYAALSTFSDLNNKLKGLSSNLICDLNINCIPQPVAPIDWKEKYDLWFGQNGLDFTTVTNNNGETDLVSATIQDYYFSSTYLEENFYNMNYEFLVDAYLEYLGQPGDAFHVDSVDHPHFLTLAEFGDTNLNYGYNDISTVITSFKGYVVNINAERSWRDYVNNIWLDANPNVCPPAPMYPKEGIIIDPDTFDNNCETFSINVAATYTQDIYQNYLNTLREEFIKDYVNSAMEYASESFDMNYSDKEYQYTLYYYDQAGNLVQTVAPEGVDRATQDHAFKTQYRYNSLNQLVWQRTPDGGETRFAYDRLGRIIASQNAKQAKLGAFGPAPSTALSYTKYDGLGRIIEAGEIESPHAIDFVAGTSASKYSIGDDGLLYENFLNSESRVINSVYDTNNKKQITTTLYSQSSTLAGGLGFTQNNLRNRVSSVIYIDDSTSGLDCNNAIFYDYDIHGNVKKMAYYVYLGEDANKSLKITEYDYDLISGNVKQVIYQKEQPDQFIHRYQYDADNRITAVQTSRDGMIWETDASYQYYKHGPLARTELGEQKVQGLDYAYTIHGWLKGVNGEQAGVNDLGNDNGSLVAKDAFGFSLNYFSGDYATIGTAEQPFTVAEEQNSIPNTSYNTRNLYNGNIKTMVTSLIDENESALGVLQNNYTYDQLNRIKVMTSFDLNNSAGVPDYYNTYQYDKNGNLTSLNRYLDALVPVDELNYIYNTSASTELRNNRLYAVKEEADVDDNFSTDIDSGQTEGTFLSTTGEFNNSNYQYDAIGQLIKDEQEGITNIDWRVDGKVASITKEGEGNTETTISFEYDGLGNRLSKTHIPNGDETQATNTYYIRDAQGNVMAVYEKGLVELTSPSDYFVTPGTIHSGTETIEALENIVLTNYTATPTSNVTITSGNSVTLKPGTTLLEGTTTHIFIDPNIDIPPVTQIVDLKLSEHHIYGSSRLGIQEYSEIPTVSTTDFYNTVGDKRYELSNHLGNVLSVISDRKLVKSGIFTPDVLSYNDYYPFGMTLPNRSGSAGSYRYGFQGQEKDDEISGEGNSYSAEFWQYDPRVARRWNTDPVVVANESPYAAFRNSPIMFNDPEGDCSDCPDNPKKNQVHISKNTGRNGGLPFKAPNGEMLSGTDGKGIVYADDLSNVAWIYTGDDAGWQAFAFETKDGNTFVWDSDKAWYTTSAGEEFDDITSFNITNAIGKNVSPLVQVAIDKYTKGDAFKSFKQALNEHGGSLSSFVWDGLKETASSLVEDGREGSQARLSLFTGFLSGGPSGVMGAQEFAIGSSIFKSVSKKSLGLKNAFGYSGRLNYFSALMYKTMGTGTKLSVRKQAGIFVQISHNIGNIMSKKNFKLLYSKDKAAYFGRQLQNNAMGTGLLQMNYQSIMLGGTNVSEFLRNNEKDE